MAANNGGSARGPGRPFQPGQSGNPSGRPKEDMRVRELARKRTVLAIKTLTQLCKSADKDSVRVQAAIALLDRGYGKPAQTTDLNVQAVKGGVMIQLPAVEAEPAPEPASDAVE